MTAEDIERIRGRALEELAIAKEFATGGPLEVEAQETIALCDLAMEGLAARKAARVSKYNQAIERGDLAAALAHKEAEE